MIKELNVLKKKKNKFLTGDKNEMIEDNDFESKRLYVIMRRETHDFTRFWK